MELTSKERARLRSLASKEDTIFLVGKEGLTDTIVDQIDKALTKRELIKIGTLETAPVEVREAALEIAEKTGSVVVQTIGSKMVLYRPNDKKPSKPKMNPMKARKIKLRKAKEKAKAENRKRFEHHGKDSSQRTEYKKPQHQTER